MVLFIIVCIIAWGVCRFKKVDFLSTLFIGFLIGIASIFISGFIGLCTASLTQTEVKTETYKMENYPPIVKKMFILPRWLQDEEFWCNNSSFTGFIIGLAVVPLKLKNII